jgi:hypothetical protein
MHTYIHTYNIHILSQQEPFQLTVFNNMLIAASNIYIYIYIYIYVEKIIIHTYNIHILSQQEPFQLTIFHNMLPECGKNLCCLKL